MLYIISPFILIIVTFFSNLFIQRYLIKKKNYEKFFVSFIACVTASGWIEPNENDKLRISKMNKYSLQEQIIRLTASKKLIKLLDQLRLDSGMEEDRPLWLSTPINKNSTWKPLNEDAIYKYFSHGNYKKLQLILKKDLYHSLRFLLGLS